MTRIAIVVGSTRPGRRAAAVADWVHTTGRQHLEGGSSAAGEVELSVLDLADHDLPLLDEPVPPMAHRYQHDHTQRWAAAVASYDGFVFVTPEYNHGTSAALKNALDYLYAEWNDKAAGFVSYGVDGGQRAVEQLRLTCAELQIATVRSQVALRFATDFDDHDVRPSARAEETLTALLDQLASWANALVTVRLDRARRASGNQVPSR